MMRLHEFRGEVSGVVPERFTQPFCYVPHPLCVEAAKLVQQYITEQKQQAAEQHQSDGQQGEVRWLEELDHGKMLGVLVVQEHDGAQPKFLAAFSGNLADSNDLPYFVPAVYDLLRPDGEFKRGEAEITLINHRIDALAQSPSLIKMREDLASATSHGRMEIEAFKQKMAESKLRRDALRAAGNVSSEKNEQLLNESRFQKAELKRQRQHIDIQLNELRNKIALHEDEIARLKVQRKAMSEALQERIFRLFVVEDATGRRSDLTDIFAHAEGKLPPSGSGECCAPKLLHYAYTHSLKPLAMAEFWWGASPAGEVRHHGHFYPACRSKCKPILNFMLQGLDVEENEAEVALEEKGLEIVYDDQWLMVVNKPSGMLSVPGKELEDSAYTRFRRLEPQATGPIVVHRLDQETSGLLIFAKDKGTHKALQQQFATHAITKRYIALLSSEIVEDEGIIDLPLCPDISDRPRQMVSHKMGKTATTRYRVVERRGATTRVEFYPLTGRTHQLRVHASHPQGLNAPIVGDRLYGTASERLMLHAQSITFIHPGTGKSLTVTTPPPF